ncbi:MAG: M15 family metallopeptidase [Bacteroidota bacterium]
MRYLFTFLGILALSSCKQKSAVAFPSATEEQQVQVTDTVKVNQGQQAPKLKVFGDLVDTTFVRLADYSHDFAYDMRYATENNFLKAQVYDCAECYIRIKTAKALLKANAAFLEKGYRIKFFDCYRPNSVQHKMWELFPNPQYVANPVKGSIHNKGGAVDITLIDMKGGELDMGTDFDYFGKKAHHDHLDLPQEVLDNRKLLRETMENNGFWGIRTEWWHYNLSGGSKDKVADFKWECE